MRQSIRSQTPARADRVTAFRSRNQMFGGEPLWAVSPYLANGADSRTQNDVGNVHCQNGGQTTTASAVSMALSALGDPPDTGIAVEFNASISGSTMTVHSIASGGNNLLSGAGTPNRLRIRYASQPGSPDGEFYITAAGTGTGGTGTYTIAGDLDNATTQDMRALSPLASADGNPALQIIDNAGKKRYRFRIGFDDRDASGQSGRKMLIRNGDTGSERSNGLGTLNPLGSTQLCAFAFEIDAATKAIVGEMGNTLIWQLKNSSGDPVVSLSFTNGVPNGGTNPPGIIANPDILLRCAPGPWRAQVRVINDYPIDTPMYWLVRVRTGIAQWIAGKYYGIGSGGRGEFVHNAGNVYERTNPGAANDIVSGVTAPTGTGSGISDGACVWNWVMATPAGNVEPRCEVWLKVGTAAWAKVGDFTSTSGTTLPGSRTNIYPDVAAGINTQWGWYANNAYDAEWSAGLYMALDCSELIVARQNIAVIDPSDYVLNQWFDQMVSRF